MGAAFPLQWNLVIPGLLVGIFGWMLYWAGTAAIGAIIGGTALGMLGYVLGGLVPAEWAPDAGLWIGVVLGVIGGVIFIRALLVYFFFTAGASLGGAFVWWLAKNGHLAIIPNASSGTGLHIGIVVGMVLGGFLLVSMRRFVIAVITALIGASLLASGVPYAWQGWAWLMSAVIFLTIQAGLVRRYVDRESFDRRAMHPRYRRDETIIDEDE